MEPFEEGVPALEGSPMVVEDDEQSKREEQLRDDLEDYGEPLAFPHIKAKQNHHMIMYFWRIWCFKKRKGHQEQLAI